jgi:hypothetical protein
MASSERLLSLPPHRILHEALCWIFFFGVPLSHELYGWPGLAAHTLLCLLGPITMDWFVSPTFKNNLKRLNANGYSTSTVVATMILNLAATNVLVCGIKEIYCENGTLSRLLSADAAKHELPISLVLVQTLVNLVLAEITFTVGHFFLHHNEHGANWHLMHHCCKPCSWSANLIFHPCDMAVEFSGPMLSLVLSHELYFKHVDPSGAGLLVSMTVMHFWYAIDHSENLKLYHYEHHMRVDSLYTIYIKLRTLSLLGPRKDWVRKLMK